MSVRDEFDAQAADGHDKGMEDRHWHTAEHALARMPIEEGGTVIDLGAGSGYALRTLRGTEGIGRGFGLGGSPEMVQNAHAYTDADDLSFLVGGFDDLPFGDDSVSHVWSMEAFYYAANPHHTLEEIARILRPGGTFYCAVNYYEENIRSHEWQGRISIDITRWSHAEYREAFRDAGLHVAEQDSIADLDIDIPATTGFPTDDWETRGAMVERYRTFGTLLTVGIAP